MPRCQARALPRGYDTEVDALDESAWNDALDQFGDANIYQTWAYGEVRAGSRNVSRFILRRHGNVVAAAQARVVRAPLLPIGIAYIRWGPLWQLRGAPADPEVARHAVRALRNEYSCRRGLVLRLNPAAFAESAGPMPEILAQEGFDALAHTQRDRTIVLDLRRSPDELRAGMRQHWRRQLRAAEKQDLTVVTGTGTDLFEAFVKVYKEMVHRKKFPEPNDINEFAAIQRRLPDRHKMRVSLCRAGDAICAGLVSSALGDTAIYLFGATSDAGLKVKGSYLLHWQLIESLKTRGAIFYDLHGVNAVRNPGGYRFKSDLCGDNGQELEFIGQFEVRGGFLSDASVKAGEVLRRVARAAQAARLEGGSSHG